MTVEYLWIAALMFFGVLLLYWRKKRKFDRVNEQGVEVFKSYPKKVRADAFDTLLLWAGYVSVICGVLVLMGIHQPVLGLVSLSVLLVLLMRKPGNRRK
jgi:uncharacterized membrane protein YphA (DoxX/SURF4 family)